MNLQTTKIGDVIVVALNGQIDGSTAPVVQQQMLSLLQPGSKILLDMSDLTYMSSAGLRILLLLDRQISATGSRLVLVGLSEEIRDMMFITGFLNFFTVCSTLEAGLEKLNHHGAD